MRTCPDLGILLLGKVRGNLLALLLGSADQEFHVRQVARLTRTAPGPVQRELKRLAQIGVISRREVGRQVFYRAKPTCPVLPELSALAMKTFGAAGLLSASLAPLEPQIRVGFIFGSLAQGFHRPESDIDLMVIGEVSFTEVSRAALDAQRRLGREVNPTVYRPADFAAKLTGGSHFLKTVMTRPKVFLIGDEHELSRVAEERVAQAAPHKPRRSRRTARRHDQ